MSHPGEAHGPVHRAIYAAHLATLVSRWGVTREALLESTGIGPGELEDPDGLIGGAAMSRLCQRALELTGEPGLGFYQGLHVKLSAHGAVGMATMTQATLAQALEVGTRYFSLRAQHLALHSRTEGDEVVLELEELVPLGPVRGFWLEVMITSFVQMGKTLLGRPMFGRVELAIAEPAHFQGFAHLWPGPVRFGCAQNRLIIPRSLLEMPLQMSDAFASEKAVADCERELSRLGETSSLLASVRRQLMALPRGFPSATELARKRHVSLRTLKRHLAAHGTSYQLLLDELRRDRALDLLDAEPPPSVATIAELLGYSDPSNFNRAFHRWMGMSTTEWRDSRRPGRPARP